MENLMISKSRIWEILEFLPVFECEKKFSLKRKFSEGRPCGHPAKNFGQALQIPGN